jgi:hypothetical protein
MLIISRAKELTFKKPLVRNQHTPPENTSFSKRCVEGDLPALKAKH